MTERGGAALGLAGHRGRPLLRSLRLKSRQVRISTGVSRITTPRIVSIEVAAAEPNSGT